jgi:hypothetical protein
MKWELNEILELLSLKSLMDCSMLFHSLGKSVLWQFAKDKQDYYERKTFHFS